MPFTVSWQYSATVTHSVTFPNVTAARAAGITQRYARRHGLAAEGMTDEQIAKAAIRHVMEQVAAESAHTQRQEAVAAQEATLEATIATDNALS